MSSKQQTESGTSDGIGSVQAPHIPHQPAPSDRSTRFRRKSYLQYSDFLSKQMSASASFILSTTDIEKSCADDVAALPNRYSGNFRLLAQIGRHVVAMGRQLAVDDIYSHPILRNTREMQYASIGAYIGTPIFGSDGSPAGVICVVDTKIRYWTYVELTLLTQIAREIEADWRHREAEFDRSAPATEARAEPQT